MNRPGRKVRKVDPAYLERAAVHYLSRFGGAASDVRRILMRRVRKSHEAYGTSLDEATAWVDEAIDKLRRLGLIDDRAYGQARVRQWLRRGRPTAWIRQALRQKDLPGSVIDACLEEADEESLHPDIAAALAYIKRRRFGPFERSRTNEDPAATRHKQLAALARRGFSYHIADSLISASSPEEIEARARQLSAQSRNR